MCTAFAPKNMLDRDDCLLVIIDAQEKLMPAITGKEQVLDNLVRLSRFAAIVGLPVIVTEQEKLGPLVPQIRELLPAADPVGKVHFDCLSCDEFRLKVEDAGRRTLVLTGAEAHICVAQTALAALPRYNVHVVADAISSRTLENKQVALQRMAQAGSVVTSTEMFIYEILKRAGTDEFKAVLPLVK